MENEATVADVLAIIDRMSQETQAMLEKTGAEMRAMFKATDEQIKATDKQIQETNKQIKATNRKIGELGDRLGEIAEYLVSPHLEEQFKRFNIFLDTCIMRHSLEEPGKGIIAEIDIFLSNGDYAVAVEVKTKPDIQDVADHAERMKKIRAYADKHQDRRKYLGAVAGMVVRDQVKAYAYKQGFPVLVPSGESIALECPEGFTPKEW
ncbi:MAG: hypothetical protein LBC51_07050 [Treponema sp.]|jgi:chromosome segregation ATPase|nr:hypothetical protein [Treponema sp.]